MQHLASLTVQCLVFLILLNLENNLVLWKGHYLVYLRELLKAYLNLSILVLMKAVVNTMHLAELNETMKESKIYLYLDLRITLLMVIYYEVLWAFLTLFLMT